MDKYAPLAITDDAYIRQHWLMVSIGTVLMVPGWLTFVIDHRLERKPTLMVRVSDVNGKGTIRDYPHYPNPSGTHKLFVRALNAFTYK